MRKTKKYCINCKNFSPEREPQQLLRYREMKCLKVLSESKKESPIYGKINKIKQYCQLKQNKSFNCQYYEEPQGIIENINFFLRYSDIV